MEDHNFSQIERDYLIAENARAATEAGGVDASDSRSGPAFSGGEPSALLYYGSGSGLEDHEECVHHVEEEEEQEQEQEQEEEEEEDGEEDGEKEEEEKEEVDEQETAAAAAAADAASDETAGAAAEEPAEAGAAAQHETEEAIQASPPRRYFTPLPMQTPAAHKGHSRILPKLVADAAASSSFSSSSSSAAAAAAAAVPAPPPALPALPAEPVEAMVSAGEFLRRCAAAWPAASKAFRTAHDAVLRRHRGE